MLFSDHGYHFGEKDEVWKYTHWEDCTRVPFIVSDPRKPQHAGKTVNHPISLIDVFPTITELGGMTGTTILDDNGVPVDGHSLVPFLEDPDNGMWDGPDVALMVTFSFTGSDKPRDQNLSVRSSRYRYILYANGGEELYDHSTDPNEWNNLADNPEYASVVEKMKERLYEIVPGEPEEASLANLTPEEKRRKELEDWKNKVFFPENPKADANIDGILTWPELRAYREKTGI